MTITERQRRQILRALGQYKALLESSIETAIIPGTNHAMPGDDSVNLEADRRAWRQAENLAIALERRQR